MVRSVNLWDGRRVSKPKTFWETNYFVENFGIVCSIILWDGRRLRIILQKFRRFIFQEFAEMNYFPKIKIRGLKKLVEIIFVLLLKIKRR